MGEHTSTRLIRAFDDFYCERARRPAFFLVGWRAWLYLGDELSSVDDPAIRRVTLWLDIPIVVDEKQPDVVQAMPHVNYVRFGGGVG